MGFDDHLADHQPETGAAAVSLLSSATAAVFLKQLIDLRRRHPHAVISNFNLHAEAAVVLSGNLDQSARIGELDRITEEIVEHLFEPPAIPLDLKQVFAHAAGETKLLLFDQSLIVFHRVTD